MLCQEDYMLLSDCSAPLRKAKCLLVFSFSKDRILFVIMQHLFYFKHEGFVKKSPNGSWSVCPETFIHLVRQRLQIYILGSAGKKEKRTTAKLSHKLFLRSFCTNLFCNIYVRPHF